MHDFNALVLLVWRRLSQLSAGVRAQGGDTLIEVLVGAVLLAIGVIGGLTAYDSTTRASSRQNQYLQEEALAHQDQEQMRAVPISQYASLPATETVQGVVYDIKRTYSYESLSGDSVCNAHGSVAYLKTTSSVTPDPGPTNPADPLDPTADATQLKRVPVTDSSFVSAPTSASLIVHVGNWDQTQPWTAANGTGGVAVDATPVTGGTPTVATTDGYGCAVFSNLSAGDYNVTVGPTTGYVTATPNNGGDGFETTASSPVDVASGLVATAAFTYAPGDSIQADFVADGQPAVGDGLMITNSQASITAPGVPQADTSWVAPATPTPQPSIVAAEMFPFALANDASGSLSDDVYAGTCASDDPESVGSSVQDQSVSLIDGATTPTVVAVQVPPLNVEIYSGNSGDIPLTFTPTSVLVKDTGCNYVRGYSGTRLAASGGSTGVLSVPYLPMGNYTVCVEAPYAPNGALTPYTYVAESADVTSNQAAGTTVAVYWGAAKLRAGPVGSGC